MRVFVSTAMRCGSTWVAKVTAELLEVPQLDFNGSGLSGGLLCREDREVLEGMEGVIKLHSSVPLALVKLGKVVTVKRDWWPSLVSNYIYNSVVREKQGLGVEKRVKRHMEMHEGMSVEALMNNFLVSQLDWVDEVYSAWKDFSKVSIHKDILNLKFKDLKNPGQVILKLAKFFDVGLTMERMHELREKFSLESFRKVWNVGGEGFDFVNSGDDDFNLSMLEPETIRILKGRYEHLQ